MKRLLAREWLWLMGCVIVAALGYAGYYAIDLTPPPAPPDVPAMVRRHFPEAYNGATDAELAAGVRARYPEYPLLKTRPNGSPDEELPMPVDSPTVPGPLALTKVHLEGTPNEHLFPRQASAAEITEVMNRLYPEPGADKMRRFGGNLLTGLLLGPVLYAIVGLIRLSIWAALTVISPEQASTAPDVETGNDRPENEPFASEKLASERLEIDPPENDR